MSDAKLYLIPSPMGDSNPKTIFPEYNWKIISNIKYFVVENIRTARRFLKLMDKSIIIDDLHFEILDKRTKFEEYSNFLEPIKKGFDVGVISEAGCPGVADPGADIVKMAHEKNIDVVPLVGPSSILMALMASGMNGQNFAFKGYLPVDNHEKIKQLKNDEIRSKKENQTQIYIETPYRNLQLLKSITESLKASTRLCIATDISLETEYIKTKTIKEWSKKAPNINKRPTIFLFHA